jgi:fructokinase
MLIGIDWGGTKIEGVAMEENGHELLRLREDTPRHDYDGCIRLIRDMIGRLEDKTGRRGSIGIGIPGSLEPVSRLGKGASSTWLLGRPVERDLFAAIQRELRVENDADCFAASEAVDGAGQGYHVVFAVILGSGAGAGIAIAGEAHHGPNNSGGEWGHNPLPFPDVTEIPGRACYCGRHGCMETWVSGRAFEAEYAQHAGKTLTAREIVEQKRGGDRLSSMLWDRYINRLARGLATVVNTLDPDVIVMGGGMSNVDELYEELPPALAARTFSTVFHTPIRRAAHGDSSGVRGAAWLWKNSQRGTPALVEGAVS